MDRRAFIAVAAVTPLAGCTDLLGGGVDTTMESGDIVEFSADEGAELTVTVDVQELDEPAEAEDGEEVTHERDELSVIIRNEDDDAVESRGVEDFESFEITAESGGDYEVQILGGTAEVTIE